MGKTGWNPIHISAETGHANMVNLLIENGADISTYTPEHLTALDLAKEKGNIDRCSIRADI